MAIQISQADLTAKVNEGWKKDRLATHYGLPVSQMTQVLKDANLKIRKFHQPKYVLVPDVAAIPVETEVFNDISDETLVRAELPEEVVYSDSAEQPETYDMAIPMPDSDEEAEAIASLDAQSAVEETATASVTTDDSGTW